MINAWIIGYFVGAFAARTLPLFTVLSVDLVTIPDGVWLLGMLGVPLIRRFLNVGRAAVAFGAMFGLIWGATHAGLTRVPASPREQSLSGPARVLKCNQCDGSTGAALVGNSGAVVEAAAAPGRRGVAVALAARRPAAPIGANLVYRALRGENRDVEPSGIFSVLGQKLAARAGRNADASGRALAPFLKSIVIGDGTGLAPGLRQAFKITGLFHLLVVSGQHVTLVGLFGASLIGWPLRALYALRILPATLWRHTHAALVIAGVAPVLVYAFATGFSAATQRSVVMFVAWRVVCVFFGCPPVPKRLVVCLTAQILLFPIGLICEANLMSWCAYLLVIDRPEAADRRQRPTPWEKTRHMFFAQAKLSVLAAAAFGQLSLLGVAANLILVPVFTAAMAAGAVLVIWPAMPAGAVLRGFLWQFQQTVTALAAKLGPYAYFILAQLPLGGVLRAGALAFSGIVVLNTVRRLTIKSYVED